MYRHSVSRFEQELISLHPGEYFATKEDTILSTLLGSCVAVGIFDAEARVGGLNHFMLPGGYLELGMAASPNARYGMYAMELLINELMKLGARRSALKAKVFGGGAVLRFEAGSASRIPGENIDFAFKYLAEEGIPVLASDVGGREPRKILFFARTGKVLLKRLGGSLAGLVEKDDERYLSDLRKRPLEGPITLFE